MNNTDEGLKREIGLWGLTANIINVVIGSGIFVLPAVVSIGLGASGILAYLLCGFLLTVIMLCFAEVGSKITLTGGAYAYIETAFGKYFGFLTTSLFIFGASLMGAAAVANALANTLSYLMPIFKDPLFRAGFFILIFSSLAFVNVIGVKEGIAVVKFTTAAKLTPLLILIIWGATEVSAENLKWDRVPSINEVGAIALILFFAFQGAENGFSVSGEVKDPRKTFPKSILLSFAIILTIYISVQVVSQGILGNDFSSYKTAPLAEVARRIMGPFGVTLIIIGASVSMFGYLSGDIINMPRVLFRSALDRVIPVKSLSRVHPTFATPHVSVIVFPTLACFFAITGEFEQLAMLSSSSVLLIYMGVALAVIKLRRDGDDTAGFRIPGGYIVPILSVITILWFLSNLTSEKMIGMVTAISILSLVYYVIRSFDRPIT